VDKQRWRIEFGKVCRAQIGGLARRMQRIREQYQSSYKLRLLGGKHG
jgi:hypothetical protein